jgi:glycosyl transferase family 87
VLSPSSALPARAFRARWLGLTALAILFAVLAVRGAFRPGNDFESYHRSGSWFVAGRDLYAFGGLMPYRYVPGITAIFAPFAALSFPAARAAWSALTAVLAFASALWVDRRVGARGALAVPLAWLCLLQPFFQELSHGQVDVLVLVLAMGAFWAEDAGWELAAGVLVALAAALKAAPIVLVLPWVLQRRWRPLAGVALGTALLAAAPIPTYGFAGTIRQHLDFLALNSADIQIRRGEGANQSLWSMAHDLGLGFAGGALASAALLALALSSKDLARRRLLLLATVPLVSGYGWPQGFLLATPLLAELLAGDRYLAWSAGALAAGVSLLTYDVAGLRAEMWAQEHRVLGLLLLAVVLIGRVSVASPRECLPVGDAGPGA